jgi:RimJ/RimL family protein N-acetyltransferase
MDTPEVPVHLALVRFGLEDIDELLQWIPNAAFLALWSGPAYRFADLRKDLENDVGITSVEPQSLFMFKIEDSESHRSIGHVQLFVDRTNNMAMMGRVLVGPTALRGKGLGQLAVDLVLRHCFQTLRLHRVSLNVYDKNPAAIRCYEKSGFIREGILREATLVDGEYRNSILMGILESGYKPMQNVQSAQPDPQHD